jgi:hypothetical protein
MDFGCTLEECQERLGARYKVIERRERLDVRGNEFDEVSYMCEPPHSGGDFDPYKMGIVVQADVASAVEALKNVFFGRLRMRLSPITDHDTVEFCVLPDMHLRDGSFLQFYARLSTYRSGT